MKDDIIAPPQQPAMPVAEPPQSPIETPAQIDVAPQSVVAEPPAVVSPPPVSKTTDPVSMLEANPSMDPLAALPVPVVSVPPQPPAPVVEQSVPDSQLKSEVQLSPEQKANPEAKVAAPSTKAAKPRKERSSTPVLAIILSIVIVCLLTEVAILLGLQGK